MAVHPLNVASHFRSVPKPKIPGQRSQGVEEVRATHGTEDHRWIDYPVVAVLACATIAFWVGVAYLVATAWKN
jgi:hypothetical protein